VGWSAEFSEPIELPDGLTFRTLRDAATYILKLPRADQVTREWQAAMEALMLVAEHDGPTMLVRTPTQCRVLYCQKRTFAA